jgi:hypothetical protein
LEHIGLAPGFAREALEVYENWEGKDALPMKVQELMLILRIEVSKLYRTNVRPKELEKPKTKIARDVKLKEFPSDMPPA